MKTMTKIGKYWIIRSKKTGAYLPELEKPTRGGYTHTEPSTVLKPRLFTTERGAKNALWWWLRGEVTVRVTMADFGAFDPEPSEDWQTNAKPDRKAEDMEVIPVILSDVPHLDDGVTND
jgi:hypothetical protein